MRKIVAAAALPVYLTLAGLSSTATQAAEIKVWSGGAFRPVLDKLGPAFERATGHKLAIEFAASPAFTQRLEAGQSFDVAILLPATIDDWIRQGRILAETRSNIARASLGIAVRAGAPKPDVTTLDAFKRALLSARAIAYSADGGVGRHFAGVLERLGVAADLKEKFRLTAAGGASTQVVAKGEAELAVAFIPAILAAPGVELAGPFPAELAFHVDLSAGVGTRASDPAAAKALVQLLASAEGIAAIKASGMEPMR